MEYSKALQLAIDHLDDHSICLSDGETIITNDKNGVSPIMYLISQGCSLEGYSCADVVVGRAAALLFKYVGIKEVHTKLISKLALDYLNEVGIAAYYDDIVDYIKNRTETGMCIMESATLNTSDPKEAYQIIKDKLISIYGREYE